MAPPTKDEITLDTHGWEVLAPIRPLETVAVRCERLLDLVDFAEPKALEVEVDSSGVLCVRGAATPLTADARTALLEAHALLRAHVSEALQTQLPDRRVQACLGVRLHVLVGHSSVVGRRAPAHALSDDGLPPSSHEDPEQWQPCGVCGNPTLSEAEVAKLRAKVLNETKPRRDLVTSEMLMLCDTCGREFHPCCVDVHIDLIEDSVWRCRSCSVKPCDYQSVWLPVFQGASPPSTKHPAPSSSGMAGEEDRAVFTGYAVAFGEGTHLVPRSDALPFTGCPPLPHTTAYRRKALYLWEPVRSSIHAVACLVPTRLKNAPTPSDRTVTVVAELTVHTPPAAEHAVDVPQESPDGEPEDGDDVMGSPAKRCRLETE